MTWLELLVAGLAVFRLAVLVGQDQGPWAVFEKFRGFLKREAKTNKPLRQSKLQEGVHCHRCESLWYGLAIAPYAYFHDRLPTWLSATGDIFLLAMALSAIGILANRAFPKR